MPIEAASSTRLLIATARATVLRWAGLASGTMPSTIRAAPGGLITGSRLVKITRKVWLKSFHMAGQAARQGAPRCRAGSEGRLIAPAAQRAGSALAWPCRP
ncbi:hypothetical protein D3C71_1433060 [compost metagenome]